MSKFAAPLAEAKISIFNLSTYITDYALVCIILICYFVIFIVIIVSSFLIYCLKVAEKTFDQAMTKLKERFEIITEDE